MELNNTVATPVVLVDGPNPPPAIPVNATIVAPLPLPVTAPVALPVEETGLALAALVALAGTVSGDVVQVKPIIPGYPNTLHYSSLGAYITQAKVTPNVPTSTYVVGVTGFNAHASATLFVQIHDVSAATIADGAVPAIVIPVPGNFSAFSYGLSHLLSAGFLIAISTTALTFTAPVGDWLSCVVRVQTA